MIDESEEFFLDSGKLLADGDGGGRTIKGWCIGGDGGGMR